MTIGTDLPVEPPILETRRLILRQHRREDFEALHALWCHPSVYCHISGQPSTRERSWGRLLQYIGMWPVLGYGFWALEEKHSGRYIGDLGFADFNREIEPPFGASPETGWVLAPDSHGRGYGSEAVARMLAWGDGFFTARSARCIISPDNPASLRIAVKHGFRKIAETTYTGETVWLHERPFRR
ncbi:MAG: GNAT family N-acetyltransferase [Phyllobacterium sp.]